MPFFIWKHINCFWYIFQLKHSLWRCRIESVTWGRWYHGSNQINARVTLWVLQNEFVANAKFHVCKSEMIFVKKKYHHQHQSNTCHHHHLHLNLCLEMSALKTFTPVAGSRVFPLFLTFRKVTVFIIAIKVIFFTMMVEPDGISKLLCEHDGRCVEVPAGDAWHHTRIHHSQTFQPVHLRISFKFDQRHILTFPALSTTAMSSFPILQVHEGW